MLGVKEGMAEIFPNRFTAVTGAELDTCVDAAGVTSWGEDCAGVVTAYIAANAIGALTVYDDAVTAALESSIVCHESNNPALPTFTGLDNCSLVTLGNGLMRYEWKGDITCINPIDNNRYTGFTQCINVAGTW